MIKVDKSINGGGGAFGALISVVATIANTAATDNVVAGRACTVYVLSDMPEGRYGTMYDKDQKQPAGKSYVKATVK